MRRNRQRIALRTRTYPLSLEETKAYVNQRLRIAGSSGRQIFDPASLAAIYHYANGIPRVVNLICEHCLVSAFADQQKVVHVDAVDAVVRDLDLGDANALADIAPPASPVRPVPAAPAPPRPPASAAPGSKSDLREALKSLTDLADRLRESEPDLRKKTKS